MTIIPYSINIPESVIKFIFSHTCLMNNNEYVLTLPD